MINKASTHPSLRSSFGGRDVSRANATYSRLRRIARMRWPEIAGRGRQEAAKLIDRITTGDRLVDPPAILRDHAPDHVDIHLIEFPSSSPMLDSLDYIEESFKSYTDNFRYGGFSETIYYSFVILLHGKVEHQLKKTCDFFHEKLKTPIRSRDLSGDTISQGVTFLTKFVGIPIESLESLSKIKDLAKIRNCIVHNAGYIQRFSERARIQELAKKPSNQMSLRTTTDPTDWQIVLTLEYCEAALVSGLRFFEETFLSTQLTDEKTVDFFESLFKYLDENRNEN